MPESVQKWIKFIISALGLAAFLYCYYVLFRGDWGANNQPTANFLQFTSGLTGLVSGFVATMFGVKISDNVDGRNENKLTAMGGFLFPLDYKWAKQILAILYIAGYFLMAIWAILIWIGPENEFRPQIIDGLASVGFGIFLAIISGYLGASKR